MDIEYRIAKLDDIDTLLNFYNDVIDFQQYEEYSPKWTKDIYPSFEDINNHIVNNRLYMGCINDILVCAGVLQLHDDPIYDGINFKIKNNVGVIHLLAVNKDYRGKGISKEFIRYLLSEAKPYVKAIHLDVLDGNDRACKLYETCEFKYVDTKEVFYEDTGKVSSIIYEYIY